MHKIIEGSEKLSTYFIEAVVIFNSIPPFSCFAADDKELLNFDYFGILIQLSIYLCLAEKENNGKDVEELLKNEKYKKDFECLFKKMENAKRRLK